MRDHSLFYFFGGENCTLRHVESLVKSVWRCLNSSWRINFDFSCLAHHLPSSLSYRLAQFFLKHDSDVETSPSCNSRRKVLMTGTWRGQIVEKLQFFLHFKGVFLTCKKLNSKSIRSELLGTKIQLTMRVQGASKTHFLVASELWTSSSSHSRQLETFPNSICV